MGTITLLVLGLVTLLAIHLFEEIKTGFRKRFIFGEMPLCWFIGINTLIYVFCTIGIFLLLTENSLGIVFAWLFAVFVLLNGAGHLLFIIFTRRYFPGSISAGFMFLAALWLIIVLACS